MRSILSLAFLFVAHLAIAQQPYYDDVNLTLTGTALYNELQTKISNASSTFDYSDARDALLDTDENPSNSSQVLLVYGYNDSDGSCTTDRTRNKSLFGGMSCEYNREHVFARSNADPTMGDVGSTTTGIGADPHNLRASDQQMNNNKGNRRFGDGSGNAGVISGGNWYPGDEWKGDVARMMMYMYTRYGSRCLPSLMGTGPTEGSTQMLQLYLQWNIEDPVSFYEDQRNDFLESAYGNRNPFIDNPVLATIIWGGDTAEDRWGLLSTAELSTDPLAFYPNPNYNGTLNISSTLPVTAIQVYSVSGQLVLSQDDFQGSTLDVSALNSGVYLVRLTEAEKQLVKRLIIH
ncbi:endonuclease [Gilvibacter sediminis]|uniref:endonuclease n=1 Tax=Gilvibacter sediminis TaxID=379071 RepID=UPI00234FFE31|nr:endonuclease [Gilvibacter sediminis]MDC7999027.1 endonuclease [Gilvibacter sediminis]